MNKILQPCRCAGFSLVEILVSVGIIAVLTIFTVPAMWGVRDSSRRAACISNMKQLAVGCMAYAQDNGGALPYSVGQGSWHRLIFPYLESEEEENTWQEPGHLAKYYFCPSDAEPYSEKLSYSWNKNLRGAGRENATRLGGLSRGSAVMLGEGMSYAFDLTERTGLEYRHGDSANFAFTDGRIENRKKAEVTEEFLKVGE